MATLGTGKGGLLLICSTLQPCPLYGEGQRESTVSRRKRRLHKGRKRVISFSTLSFQDQDHDNTVGVTQFQMSDFELCSHVSIGLAGRVGILGNAADFHDNSSKYGSLDGNIERRKLMIAFDIRCVGFMMAKMVLQELMDPSIFMMFKSFLTMGNNSSSLREFLLPIIYKKTPAGSMGLQILDRDWGAGWNLLALMLATKPAERIRWGLGSTAVRIAEEYIYGLDQRNRLAHLIDLMERLNPNTDLKKWHALLAGKWRLLYHTGRQIGLTLRQGFPRVLIGNVYLNVSSTEDNNNKFSMAADINFTSIVYANWPHDKSGKEGNLHISSNTEIGRWKRIYQTESQIRNQGTIYQKKVEEIERSFKTSQQQTRKNSRIGRWRKVSSFLSKETPSSLPVVSFASSDIELTMNLDYSANDYLFPRKILREVRLQIPPEMFDISKLLCGTYIDSRLLILRGITGSALFFTRTFGS